MPRVFHRNLSTVSESSAGLRRDFATFAEDRHASRSLFSGTNWPAMKVAPCGSLITAILVHGASKGPATTSPPSSLALAAVASASSTANVTLQMRRRSGVVVGDRIERGDDIDETFGRAHPRHLLAKAGGRLLEMVAVAGNVHIAPPGSENVFQPKTAP